jgi:hypothetical protein
MIFIDLDDTAADFVGYVNRAFGTSYKIGEGVSQEVWNEIRSHHQRIFADLEPNHDFTPIFDRIIESVGVDNVAFLTAIPHPDPKSHWPHAPMDKINWVAMYCEQRYVQVPAFIGPYAQDKHKHCEIGDILIDDNMTNCTQWENAGGIAHMYRTAHECHAFLDQHLPAVRRVA